MTEEKKNLLIKLSEGYSTQAETANKFWLVLLISSIIALTGSIEKNIDPETKNIKELIELPFTLGKRKPK